MHQREHLILESRTRSHLVRYDLAGTCPAWDTMTVVVTDNPDWSISIPNNIGCNHTPGMIVNSTGSLPTNNLDIIQRMVENVNGAMDSLLYTLGNAGSYDVGVKAVFDNG